MEKKFTIYLMFNWKTSEVQMKKRPPRNIGGFWIPIKLNLTIRIPDGQLEFKAVVDIPESKLTEFMIEELTTP